MGAIVVKISDYTNLKLEAVGADPSEEISTEPISPSPPEKVVPPSAVEPAAQ